MPGIGLQALWEKGGKTLLGSGGAFAGVFIPASVLKQETSGAYRLYHDTDLASAKKLLRGPLSTTGAVGQSFGAEPGFYRDQL
jgi:hypothetical protein